MGLPRRKTKITNDGTLSGSGSFGEKKITKRPNTTVKSLPRDLLLDVFARVASSSFTDVFNAKLWLVSYIIL